VQSLILAANNAGGMDNITELLVLNNKKPQKQKATKPVTLQKKNERGDVVHAATPDTTKAQTTVIKKRRNNTGSLLLTFLCLLLGGVAYWLWQENKKLKAVPVVIRQPNEMEKKLSDSLGVAQKTFILRDTLFAKNILLGDTVFIRQDSLHIIGNGIVLQRDSTYPGPAVFITANCKYLLLEGITFKGFATAIALQGKGLQLKNVVFQDVGTPLQHHMLLPPNDTLSGIVRDTFLIKKDSLRK
jgi:hypothetical protein